MKNRKFNAVIEINKKNGIPFSLSFDNWHVWEICKTDLKDNIFCGYQTAQLIKGRFKNHKPFYSNEYEDTLTCAINRCLQDIKSRKHLCLHCKKITDYLPDYCLDCNYKSFHELKNYEE